MKEQTYVVEFRQSPRGAWLCQWRGPGERMALDAAQRLVSEMWGPVRRYTSVRVRQGKTVLWQVHEASPSRRG